MTLEQLKAEEEELKEKLKNNKSLQTTIIESDLMLKTGISIGDKIRFFGKDCVVCGFSHSFDIHFKYRTIIDNGKLGFIEQRISKRHLDNVRVIQKNFMKPEDFQ